MKEQWRQQMQQKMAGYSQPAPEVSWDEIGQAVASRKRRARVLPLWGRRIAAAAGILLLAGAGYWAVFNHRTAEQVPTPAGQQASRPLSKEVVRQAEPSEKPVQHLLRQVSAARALLTHQAQTDLQPVQTDEEEPKAVISQEEDTVAAGQERPRERQMPAHTPPYQNTYRRQASAPDTRLTARLYLSNAMVGGNSKLSSVSSVTIPSNQEKTFNTPSDGHNGQNSVDISDTNNPQPSDDIPVSGDVRSDMYVRHHQPISVGLQLRYQLNEHWSLESGLHYTRLLADITTTTEGKSVASEQSLAYIGIPLQTSYQFFSNRHVGFYVSAGTLVEKMVEGKRTSQDRTEQVSIRPLQVSLNGAVGAEYKFTDWLSVFVEPGLGYYFDNGSSIPTLYQETPLIFNLNLGLRFSVR